MQQPSSIIRLAGAVVLFSLFSVSSPVGGGWLGITVQNVNAQLAFQLGLDISAGVLVTMVQEGGPAAQAGIRQGDVIVEVNDQRTEDIDKLRHLIAKASPGSRVRIKLIRDREERVLSVRVGERPREAA